MAVYKRTYKTYEGTLTPSWSRFSVVGRYSFATLFKSRIFTAYTVLCFLPLLGGIACMYLIHNPLAQQLLAMRMVPGFQVCCCSDCKPSCRDKDGAGTIFI